MRLIATKEHNSRTAVDETEEGGDDVKSSCPLRSGLHTYYNGENKGKEGYSGASDEVRSLGFGAGMGLPNMKKYADEFYIESEVGKGTHIKMVVNL